MSPATSLDKTTLTLQLPSPVNSYCHKKDLCRTSIWSSVSPTSASLTTYYCQEKAQDINTLTSHLLPHCPLHQSQGVSSTYAQGTCSALVASSAWNALLLTSLPHPTGPTPRVTSTGGLSWWLPKKGNVGHPPLLPL